MAAEPKAQAPELPVLAAPQALPPSHSAAGPVVAVRAAELLRLEEAAVARVAELPAAVQCRKYSAFRLDR
jgi:hypothetical protein